MANIKDDQFSGRFLVSMPDTDEGIFDRAVVYVCSHGDEGTMGFIINKKLKDFSISDLVVRLPSGDDGREILESKFLYQGGPLEKVRGFVLHSSEYHKPWTCPIDERISVSSSLEILSDMIHGTGPKENLIAMGYSGWMPMQMEKELLENRWLLVPSDPEVMFHTPDEWKWERAMDESKVDLTRFIPVTGSA